MSKISTDDIIIYHNGECSKSKGALEILLEEHIPHTVRWYLTEPLTRTELTTLLTKLSMKASELVRKNESLYLEQYKDKQITEQKWLDILTEHPLLMERPVVEKGNRAIIARPPEKIFEIIL